MQVITTALELVGALLAILGLCVVLAPMIGVGWCAVLAGVLLIGLSSLIEALR